MIRTLSRSAAVLALVSILVLTGCTAVPTPAAAPTMSSETLVAAAVQTLAAQMTEEATRNPSATPTSTNTPEPTATETPIPPTETPALPTETPAPSATTVPEVSARFLTSSAYPENKTNFSSNERFSVSIRFMNTGSTTWASGSQLKITGFEGEITVQKEAVVDRAIAPGEVIEFDLWAYCSETPGRHIWYFQMYSASGVPVPGAFASYSYISGEG